jgi:predicted ATPase
MAVLVGPNNAGKSSAIAALKAVAELLRVAARQRATNRRDDRGDQRFIYYFDTGQVELEKDNLRYQFADVETRIEVKLSNGVGVQAVWPIEAGAEEFFYLQAPSPSAHWTPLTVRESLPSIGVVPVVTPLERKEVILTRPYLMRNLSTRLASRHFRNQLELLRSEASNTHTNKLAEFHAFCAQWLPEVVLAIDAPLKRPTNEGMELDLFYREDKSSLEVAWAGDGIQVFLQILLHVFRLQGSDVIVLDEPDVYLHADLQRRLLRLLSTLSSQVIFATHSSEMILEAPPHAIVWLDRSRTSAIRSPEPATLEILADTMGIEIKMRLARLLKTRVALFVEGQDMVLLRNLAATVGASALVTEAEVVAIPIEGFSNWRRLQPFPWLVGSFLQDDVVGYVILDRDVHDPAALEGIITELAKLGIQTHVWQRNELENYLLHPDAISRLTGALPEWVHAELEAITLEMKSHVMSRMVSTRFDERSDRGVKLATIAQHCSEEVDEKWLTYDHRIGICPGKEVISALNQRLQAARYGTVNSYNLSREIRSAELPSELGEVLRHIQRLASNPIHRPRHRQGKIATHQ